MSAPTVRLLGGGSLLIGEIDGAIRERPDTVTGLFVRDTRYLTSWILETPGHTTRVVSRTASASTQTITMTPEVGRNETAPFLVTVDQTVTASGLDQSITVENLTDEYLRVPLALLVAGDFADPFALRSDRRSFGTSGRTIELAEAAHGFTASYSRSRAGLTFQATALVDAGPDAHVAWRLDGEGDGNADAQNRWSAELRWNLELQAKARRSLRVAVSPPEPQPDPVPFRLGFDGDATAAHAADDLRALQMPAPGLPGVDVLAAGAPWFLTLFGRDSLISLLLLEGEGRTLAPGILRALAETQGDTSDARRNEQPGKIVHEIRTSELATLDEVPYGRYYGSVDSTPLFLIALASAGDEDLWREFEGTARRAVAWMLGDGGLDATGFLRYTPDPDGLLHQGWKDSFDAVMHDDGTIATGDIALVEVQGYAWRALTDTARLARTVWNDDAWARELDERAAQLKSRLRSRFWNEETGFPALALDGADRRVDVVSSNAGHLLLAGILDHAEAERVTHRLLEPDMFTGYGIRTLSSAARAYHPLSYHNGSVWPHDTMLAALGMVAYGFDEEARTIAAGIRSAAVAFDDRLPELFGGFDRSGHPAPISYPFAAAPQAWATAAVIAATRLA